MRLFFASMFLFAGIQWAALSLWMMGPLAHLLVPYRVGVAGLVVAALLVGAGLYFIRSSKVIFDKR